MPKKKIAKKKTASAKKKTAAKKTATKKTAAKKTAKKKTAAKKVGAAKKSTAKKAARQQTGGKKAAKKATAAAKKAVKGGRPKASELINKRPSHTPAIFKRPSKRMTHIFLSVEEVRDLLKKRAAEEQETPEPAQAKKKNGSASESKSQAVVGEVEQKKSRHHAASLDDILGLSASGGPRGSANSVPRKFRKYYNLLIELRDHVRAELNLHSNDTLKRSQKEDAGDISISVDAGTDNFDRDFALSLLSSEQESLKEIEAAIERIHKGSYGFCEVTGEPISPERLEAVPFTRFSLEGQRQFESNSRKKVSRAGAFLNEASGDTITFGDDDGDN